MKKSKKLGVQKVTLRDLDDPKLDELAGGQETGERCVSHETNHRCTCVTCHPHTRCG